MIANDLKSKLHPDPPTRDASAADGGASASGRDASAADGSTFAPGLALLPPSIKADVECFYRVLRTIDDLVDEDDPRAQERVVALERWAHGEAAESREARALVRLERQRRLPRRWLLDFCAGMRHDLARAVVKTDVDFDRYCHQAGGSVGIVLTHLLGAGGIEPIKPIPGSAETTPGRLEEDRERASASVNDLTRLSDAERWMGALGRAMQVTNIARDIDEDLAHGRTYIPSSLIEHYGFPSPGRREGLLRELIARADALYEEGERAIPMLREGQAAMALAAALYREILREIERDGFGRREGRVAVPAWRTRELVAAHERAGGGAVFG
jgi:phytoene synthase